MALSRTYRVIGALFLVAGMLIVPAVPAAGDDGIAYEGNPKCEDLGPTWTTLYKADFDEGAPASGSHGPVTWDVRITDNGEVVDWSSTTPLVVVLVKGGPGGYWYDYGAAGGTADSGLHALARRNGNWADVSHITFCRVEPEPEPEPATLTLTKITDPADDDVTFRFIGPDGWKPVLGHGDTSTIEVEPGTYTLREKFEHAWHLTSIDCDGGDPVIDLAAGTATVTVGEGDDVACTYTNSVTCPQHGYIAIEKYTDPVDETVPFAFTSDAESREGEPFRPVLHHGESDYVMVQPGTYSITELPVAGWRLGNLTCDDPDAVVDLATATATVTVTSDEYATCEFTNVPIDEPEPGQLVIRKSTDPRGATEQWNFTSDIAGFAPVLGDGESASVTVDAGTYTVAEQLDQNWKLTSLTCTDPEAAIDLATGSATVFIPAGERITCSYTNTKLPEPEPGRIVIEKETDPEGATDDFGFLVTAREDMVVHEADLHDGESVTLEVDPGAYAIVEVFDPDWELSAISCDPTGDVSVDRRTARVEVDAGETVTCTFTNTQDTPPPLGSIGDFVWNDENRNGVQDPDEPGIPGVRVNLYAALAATLGTYQVANTTTATDGLTLLATTKTDGAGLYLFSDLPAGDYVVEFTGIPSGYSFTTPFAAARTIDSDAGIADGFTPVMVLAEGFDDTTCDAGLYIVRGPTGETLPETGVDLRLPLVAGTALLALGLVLVLATRPQRQQGQMV